MKDRLSKISNSIFSNCLRTNKATYTIRNIEVSMGKRQDSEKKSVVVPMAPPAPRAPASQRNTHTHTAYASHTRTHSQALSGAAAGRAKLKLPWLALTKSLTKHSYAAYAVAGRWMTACRSKGTRAYTHALAPAALSATKACVAAYKDPRMQQALARGREMLTHAVEGLTFPLRGPTLLHKAEQVSVCVCVREIESECVCVIDK
jgi:hypothetical protein